MVITLDLINEAEELLLQANESLDINDDKREIIRKHIFYITGRIVIMRALYEDFHKTKLNDISNSLKVVYK